MSIFSDIAELTSKAAGFNPAELMQQAKTLSTFFEHIARSAERQEATLARMEANQHAIMTAMGIYVPPTEEVAALIADESARHITALEEPRAVRGMNA